MSAIETLGVALPKLMVEAVAPPGNPDHFQLHTWNGRRVNTTSRLEHGGASYIPMKLASGVGQLVRFAPPSLPFGSTSELSLSLRPHSPNCRTVFSVTTLIGSSYGSGTCIRPRLIVDITRTERNEAADDFCLPRRGGA